MSSAWAQVSYQSASTPSPPLAHVVLAAVNEAALYIAGAADPVAA